MWLLIFSLPGSNSFLLALVPLRQRRQLHMPRALLAPCLCHPPVCVFSFIFNITLVAMALRLPMLGVIKMIMNSITLGYWIFNRFTWDEAGGGGSKVYDEERRMKGRYCAQWLRLIVVGEHEKKKNYICLFQKKGGGNLGSAAAPHQSVSRTNTHGSNPAWEFVNAVCSCDESERIDSPSCTPPLQNHIPSLWIRTSTCERTGGKSTATCFNYPSQAWSVLRNIDFQHLCIGYRNFSSLLMITQCLWPGKSKKEMREIGQKGVRWAAFWGDVLSQEKKN